MATAPGIPPRLSDARAYELVLRHTILNPFVRDIDAALKAAERDFRQIAMVLDAIPVPTHPALHRHAFTAASRHAVRLKAYHTARMRKTMIKHFGVKVRMLDDAVLKPLIERAIQENVDLIVTIPQRHHAKLVQDFRKLAADAPFDQQQMRTILRDGYKSSGYNLRRLTRDQTGKLIGRFTEARHKQLGIDRYQWSTSKDNRVRPTHRENDGREFRWDSPPPTGPPGHEAQCRCVSIPVFDPPQRAR